jgi:formamidase
VNDPQILRVDIGRSLVDDVTSGHNRWHAEIPPLVAVEPNELISIDIRDGLDGQVTETDPPSGSPFTLDLLRGHPLTGPIAIVGAEPGDLLTVEIVDIEPASFGFTCVRPGGGLLGEEISEPFIARWTIRNGLARSDDVPGVVIQGSPFLGVMGIAPSTDRLKLFATREEDLARRGGRATLPDPASAVPSTGSGATAGLRTIPPRETGGNLDIKHLKKSARLTLPVDVPGALFSVGDAHFAQGNGEVCSQAIEIAARTLLRFSLTKNNAVRWRPKYPLVHVAAGADPIPPGPRLITTGLPLDGDGLNHDMNLRLAAREAVREMMDYLVEELGYSRAQAYVICSVAVDLEISEAVNGANGLVAAVLPLNIFQE